MRSELPPEPTAPRWLRRLAALLVHGPEAPYVLGDLDEAYTRDLARGLPTARARRRYLRNALASALRLVRARVRTPRFAPSLLDVKLGLRMLRKQPALTVVAVFALSMGIPVGLLPYHIAQINARPLPFEEGERIVKLQNRNVETRRVDGRLVRDLHLWREGLTTFETIGAASSELRNVGPDDGGAAPIQGAAMTSSAFDMVRVAPLMGRPLVETDERPGAPDVVVIAYDLWQSRLGGDPEVVGRTMRIGSVPHEVVGVMPEGFLFPDQQHFWVPLRANPVDYAWGEGPWMWVFGRLADGVTIAQANAELDAIGRRIAAEHPDTHRLLRAEVVRYTGEDMYADPQFWILQLLALLLLAVACGNVGTLVLARTATRTGEIAVRTALGASRARVVGQLFVETLLLAALAAGFGLALGEVAARRIEAIFVPRGIPFWMDMGVTWRTATTALLLAAFSATVAGVLPALKATGSGVQRSLQRAAAGVSGIRFGGLATALIVAEVATATAFLVMGGMVLPSVLQDPAEGMGLPAEEYLAATLHVPRPEQAVGAGSPDAAAYDLRVRADQSELMRRLSAEPGVRGVALGSRVPGEDHPTARVEVEGAGTGLHRVQVAYVDVGFFRALGQPIRFGRDFARADVAGGAQERTAVIVNGTFVRDVLGGRSPIGERFRYGARPGEEPEPWLEIVGVVGHLGMNETSPERDAGLYVPVATGELNPARLAILTVGDPASFIPDLRRLAEEVDPEAMIQNPVPLDENARLSETRIGSFWGGLVLAMIAGVAVVLSAAGLYALVSFTVSERRREIGIRTALGARTGSIVATIARRAAMQLAAGVVAGLVLWKLLDRFVVGLSGDPALQRISPAVLVGAAAGATLVVGLLACVPPLLRALRIRPVEVLKEV